MSSEKSFTSSNPVVDNSALAKVTTDEEVALENEQDTAQGAAATTAVDPVFPRDVHGWSWALVILSILCSTFLFGLDNTIAADVQPAIVESFNSINKISWVSVAFMMGAGSTNLFWGQMYSQFNLKYLYIISIVLFQIGSALCGAAPNMNVLIVGRAICGVGGAGSYVGVMTLISVLTTDQERSAYLSIPSITWGTAMVLGPIIGGAFTVSKAGWRWAFYINLLIGAACAPVYLILVPSKDARPGVSLKDRINKIDFVGFFILSGIFVSLLMAISFGGAVYPWGSGHIIALFIVSGVLVIFYWLQQGLSIGTPRANRMIPFEFIRNVQLMLVFLCGTTSATATYIPVYFLPLYFQLVRGDSALMAGVRLLPLVCFLIASILIAGQVVSRTGHWQGWFLGGSVIVLIGGVLLYAIDEHTSNAKIYGYSILVGTGAGSYLQLPFAAAQYSVAPIWIPVAVGLISFAQLAAPSVALSIANTVFVNKATLNLSVYLPDYSGDQITRIISGVGSQYLELMSPSQREGVNSIITHAIGKSYILVITCGGTSLILSTFLIGLSIVNRRKSKTARNGIY
ncbi:efflux pump antibiotic resistance protein, putative [Talaromyces stipitatus ATCC 10500]|uniref:Efflux pump antibiotic resistance protein, putative n=1 Tax=Talaromyces stipitatus (strain ATCC 10500 / CBS 375.48 / QM 6759 / NRRL 1006) TaxID=441959 RepID=B8M873_TALSN|nr:efflux pump antibiotic resistance protein, putative [Talaromyces stipitatus ATCC 10500]EED20035.1 efflux pump antibiotic resistance protein, putative [Talaromyces stipitatus ATCC 10500]